MTSSSWATDAFTDTLLAGSNRQQVGATTVPQATQALLDGNYFLPLLTHLFVLDYLDFSCTSRAALYPCPGLSIWCPEASVAQWPQVSPSQHALLCSWYLSHPAHLWSEYVLPCKCPFSLFIKCTLVTSLDILPITKFYNRNRKEANPKLLFPNKHHLSLVLLWRLLFPNVIFKKKNMQHIPEHITVFKRIRGSYYPLQWFKTNTHIIVSNIYRKASC